MDSRPAEGAARVILGAVYFSAGRWDEAEAELRSDVAVNCPLQAVAIMRRVALCRLLDARGSSEEAAETLAAVDPAVFPHGAVWLSTTHAVHRLAAGDAAGARAALDAAISAHEAVRCLACEAMLGGMGAEILGTLGDRAGALALAARADRAGEGAFVGGRLMAARGRIAAALADGDFDEAVDEAQDAQPLSETVNQPFEHARLLALHAAALISRAHDDDLDRAGTLVGEALATFERLGARPSAERAHAELGRLESARAALLASL
jgi:hypothetical protein